MAEQENIPVPFLMLTMLFGAAAQGANREEKRKLWEAREMIKARKPLDEIAQAILDARGPDWTPGEEFLVAMQRMKEAQQ